MNNYLNSLIHQGLYIINKLRFYKFRYGMKNVQRIQQQILQNTLKHLSYTNKYSDKLKEIKSYNDFKKLPITDYNDYLEDIEFQKKHKNNQICNNLVRYQPTSGSTSQIKWIPYNKELLLDFDLAASVWMYDMAKRYPKTKKGKHYWSLSWLPEDLRETMNLDDSEILSPMKRYLMQSYFAVPKQVMNTLHIDDNLFGTSCFLVSTHDLSLISVWSPTFLLSILEYILKNKSEIIDTLLIGNWSQKRNIPIKAPKSKYQAKVLDHLDSTDSLYKLWPNLSLISCWDTAQSHDYANKIRNIFPNTPIQGKGLWSTEAVITLPISNKYLLAYQSHFYEFEDFITKTIYPSWKLQKGMKVSPIVTTPNGFLRYRLNDLLIVDDIYHGIPALTFIERIKDCDLVGEKLSQEITIKLFEKIEKFCKPLSLLGIKSPKNDLPYYALIIEHLSISKDSLELECENFLQRSYHYRLARDLNQLAAVKVFHTDNAFKLYESLLLDKGMIKGNIKIEPLITIETDHLLR